jgi:hypothetical protein
VADYSYSSCNPKNPSSDDGRQNPAQFLLFSQQQVVGYISDPTGNVACHVYTDALNLDYAFYDGWGLVTGYAPADTGLSTSLWYKGPSGAETYNFGGTNFGAIGPSDPFSWPLVPRPEGAVSSRRCFAYAAAVFWWR